MAFLTETRIRAARAFDRPYKLFDERGLFMLVTPPGGRLWRLRYRMYGREKLLSLGAYPDVTLKRAREKRDEARKLIADGAPVRPRKPSMLNQRLKKRLKRDRASTTITMRIPVDVVESLKALAPLKGFTAYQTLLKSYISEGLRRDEAQFGQPSVNKLAEVLKRRGVDEKVIDKALAEIDMK